MNETQNAKGQRSEETGHTPEPWFVNHYRAVIQTDDPSKSPVIGKKVICYLSVENRAMPVTSKEDAKRIVACANACAGINNPAAIPQIVEEARKIWEKIKADCPDESLMGNNGKLLIGFTMLDIHKIHRALAAMDMPVSETQQTPT